MSAFRWLAACPSAVSPRRDVLLSQRQCRRMVHRWMLRLLAPVTVMAVDLRRRGRSAGAAWRDPAMDFAGFVNGERLAQQLPGLAAVVVRSDGPPRVYVSGERRIGKGDLITPADRMHLGSLTKAITATMIGALAEQRLMTFETTIGQTFPELSAQIQPAYRSVSVRQLLAHTGGVPPYGTRQSLQWLLTLTGTPTEQRYAFVARVLAEPPCFEPGTGHEYSNAGPAIAGAMAERIGGSPYLQLVQQLVFAPLGGHAAFGNPGLAAEPQPWGHIRTILGTAMEVAPANAVYTTPLAIEPAGDASPSMQDSGRFLQLHLRGLRGRDDVLKATTIQALHGGPLRTSGARPGDGMGPDAARRRRVARTLRQLRRIRRLRDCSAVARRRRGRVHQCRWRAGREGRGRPGRAANCHTGRHRGPSGGPLMLDTTFVLWLQQRASPALTEIMRAVSFFGYVPSCLAVAIVCGFGWRLRLGVTLILAIRLRRCDDGRRERRVRVASSACRRCSRPDVRRLRVGSVADGARAPRCRPTTSGFPPDTWPRPRHGPWGSPGLAGHRGSSAWQLLWIALMALSRMYLGRHFPADVLGGLVVGVAGLAVARLALPPAAAGVSDAHAGTRTALGVSLIVAVALAALVRRSDSARMMPAVSVASWARPSCSCARGRSTIPVAGVDADGPHGGGARPSWCGASGRARGRSRRGQVSRS